MPSRSSSATINQTLTNFASSIAPSMQSALANFIAPSVPVGMTDGQFKQYSSRDAFQLYQTRRALGGKANRIEFNADDPVFSCRPHALEVTIDDEERRKAGSAELGLEQGKIRMLQSNITLAHEVDVFTKVAAITAVAGAGVWKDPNVSPIEELDAIIEQGALDTGLMFNSLVMGLSVWRVLRNHPKVLKMFPGAQRIGVTKEQFASLLLNPSIRIEIGAMSVDSSKLPKAADKSFVAGDNAFLFHRSEVPTQEDPSFAKTFMVEELGFAKIREYRDESSRSDVYASDWSRDIRVVAEICGKRIACALR